MLADAGHAEVMYEIATQTTHPSWGYQVEHGATTVWETWGDNPPDGSLNMKMFGAVERFLYRDVAGIGLAAPGWKEVVVKPALTHRLDRARASLETPRGRVAIDWRKEGDRLLLDLEVPATSRADVWLPMDAEDGAVTEGGATIWRDGRMDGAHPTTGEMQQVDGCLRLEVGGGSYGFAVSSANPSVP